MTHLDCAISIAERYLENEEGSLPSSDLSIYWGESGQVLFFLELYNQTKSDRYLRVIKRKTENLSKLVDKVLVDFSFFEGSVGIAYTLCKAAIVLDSPIYLRRALDILKKSNFDYGSYSHPSDLISGISGILLGHLHIHSICQEDWILENAYGWYRQLISRVNLSASGIYFDRSNLTKTGLCGFSHGGSGIALVFFELSYYFKNSAFTLLADLATKHEDAYFNAEQNNWADLRNSSLDIELISNRYTMCKEFDVLTDYNISAWCHGGPGIGLAALRGAEITEKDRYKKILTASINNIVSSFGKIENYPTLCHGSSGNALILLEIYRSTNQEHLLNLIYQIADELEKEPPSCYFNFITEDRWGSLFVGPLGVAYFLLQLSTQLKNSSILYPRLFSTAKAPHSYFSNITGYELQRELGGHFYPKTSRLLEVLNKTITYKLNSEKSFETIFSRPLLDCSSNFELPQLQEIFDLEFELERAHRGIDFNLKQFIVQTEEGKRNKVLLQDEVVLLNTPLLLAQNVTLLRTRWDWVDTQDWIDNLKKPESNYFVLIVSTPLGASKIGINYISYEILLHFKTAGSISEKMDSLLVLFDIGFETERSQIEAYIIEHIRNALNNTIIVQA